LYKHPLFILKTLLLLLKQKPAILIVQNPSIFLTIEACLLRSLFKYKLIVDAHNAGVKPFMYSTRWLLKLYEAIHKSADLTIVTNSELAKIIIRNGGKPFIMPDKVPTPCFGDNMLLSKKFNIVLIATFASDEPYESVISAASFFEKAVTFYITGNYKKADSNIIQRAGNNVVFLGYITHKTYWSLLKKANAIVDLTKKEDCLVCGAYEAVAVETPLITSDTIALRKYFNKGVVYTKPSVKSICSAVSNVINIESSLKKDICLLKQELITSWKNIEDKFVNTLNNMA
jgi:glycosyltransferase involved in cell wall biosynthesis